MEKIIKCPKGMKAIVTTIEDNGDVKIEYEKLPAEEKKVEKKKDVLDDIYEFVK